MNGGPLIYDRTVCCLDRDLEVYNRWINILGLWLRTDLLRRRSNQGRSFEIMRLSALGTPSQIHFCVCTPLVLGNQPAIHVDVAGVWGNLQASPWVIWLLCVQSRGQ